MRASLRVMVVEPSPLFRRGVRHILEATAEMVVVAEAATGSEALPLLAQRAPDVVVISSAVRGRSLPRTVGELRRRTVSCRIVCVGHWTNRQQIDELVHLGVIGCVDLGDAQDADLRRAVSLAGQSARTAARRDLTPGHTPHAVHLTIREREVLVRITQGKSSRDIGRELGISANTVAVHRARVMKKVGVRKAAALAWFAVARGFGGG